jgi:predicted N-acetyltransferase YhbS
MESGRPPPHRKRMSLELDIRPERTEDAATVRALVTAAFGADDDTADFVEAARAAASTADKT